IISPEHVSDDGGGLFSLRASIETNLIHGKENTTVHRLEPIAHIWKSAIRNHRHGIVDERLLHFTCNRSRNDSVFVLIRHRYLMRHLSSLGIRLRNPLP